MKLEDYFDFLASDDIRVKGTRIGVESVLYDYIYCEKTPEAIADRMPPITLEQVYATILYYLQNREKMNTYMKDWLEYGQNMRAQQDRNPPPIVVRLQELKTEHHEAQSDAV